MQALFIALRHLDIFSYVGSFSGPVIPDSPFDTSTVFERALANPPAFNQQIKLLWLGVGTAESAMFRDGIRGARDALKAAGVNLVYVESQGTAHEWQTWRRDLDDFAPRLFR
jgi:enterochelin esterase family protein